MAADLTAQISIVEEALVDIRDSLSANTSPKIRALRAKLETYERVAQGWSSRPPAEAQCRTLLECVMELHDEVFGVASGGMWRTANRASDTPPQPPQEASTKPVPAGSASEESASEGSVSERPTKRAPDGPVPDDARPTTNPTSPPPEE